MAPPTRWAYQGLGLLALGCAIVGALLPLLPTTVFLIIAAACFGRASPRWQARLLAHPRFGPLLRDWQAEGAVGRRAKALACAGMGLGLLLFWWRARPGPALGGVVTVLLLASALYVLSRPLPLAERARAPLALRPWGLAISLALHLALLAAGLLGPFFPSSTPPAPAAPLLVSISLLSPAAKPRPMEQREAAEVRRAAPQRAPTAPRVELPPPLDRVSEASARPVEALRAPSPPTEPPSQAAAPPSPALPPAEQPQMAGLQSNWQGRVLAHLAQQRRYPAGARARREQGVSHVRLRLNRAGQLLALRLERSSGHTELDRAALATVRAAAPLPAIPPELPDELDLLLPIEFFIGV